MGIWIYISKQIADRFKHYLDTVSRLTEDTEKQLSCFCLCACCCLTNYRCPKCSSLHSVGVDKIFDGRLIFRCSKCNICAIVPTPGSTDEAYLEFLDRCESGAGIAYGDDLKLVMQQEKIIRPSIEIDALMAASKATGDPLLEQTLRSQQDYIVDFKVID